MVLALRGGRAADHRDLLDRQLPEHVAIGDLGGVGALDRDLHPRGVDGGKGDRLVAGGVLELGGDGAVSAHVNLADQVWRQRGPRAALDLFTSAVDYARRRGIGGGWPKAESCWVLYDLGEWDELLRREQELQTRSAESGVRAQPYYIAATYGALVLTMRGRWADAATAVEDLLPGAREVEDPQVLGPVLATSAMVERARGETAAARSRIEEWAAVTRDRPFFRSQNLIDAVRIACAARDIALAEELREGVVRAAERDRLSDLTAQAVIAEARGEISVAIEAYGDAAQGWGEFECPLEHGLALFGLGRCHAAREHLERAREVFAGLGAQPLVSEVDEILRGDRSATAG